MKNPIQLHIEENEEGKLPIGKCFLLETDDDKIPLILCSGTTEKSFALPSDTLNPYLASEIN